MFLYFIVHSNISNHKKKSRRIIPNYFNDSPAVQQPSQNIPQSTSNIGQSSQQQLQDSSLLASSQINLNDNNQTQKLPFNANLPFDQLKSQLEALQTQFAVKTSELVPLAKFDELSKLQLEILQLQKLLLAALPSELKELELQEAYEECGVLEELRKKLEQDVTQLEQKLELAAKNEFISNVNALRHQQKEAASQQKYAEAAKFRDEQIKLEPEAAQLLKTAIEKENWQLAKLLSDFLSWPKGKRK